MIADIIARWLMPAMKRAVDKSQRLEEGPRTRDRQGDFFDGCESINFRVIQLSNGTAIRMDNYRPLDDYHVKQGPPRAPHIFIVKDDETVQDAIVRMLAIHQLEKP